MRITFLLSVLFLFALSSQAQAGRMFPPANVASSVTECPNGEVLKWSGNSVVCENPTPGVTVPTCPAGQVITGINHGVPICTPLAASTFTCPSGQVLTGMSSGTPVCSPAATNTMTFSCPTGQVVSGFNNGTPICSTASAGTHYSSCVWREIGHGGGSNWSGYTRTHANEMGIACENGEVLAGISQILMSTGGLAKILCCK